MELKTKRKCYKNVKMKIVLVKKNLYMMISRMKKKTKKLLQVMKVLVT